MAAALASTDNRNQAALARLEALENDNAGMETIDVNDDEDASLDDDDEGQISYYSSIFLVLILLFYFYFAFKMEVNRSGS